MAATRAGALLTQGHRQRQLQLRAVTLRQLLALWPTWNVGDDATFAALVASLVPLVEARRGDSAALAAAYYQAFRTAEGARGPAEPRTAAAVDRRRLVASLYVTGQVAARRGLRAGHKPDAAKANAFVLLSGAVARHVLDGGREALRDSVRADRSARGWQRVTSASPCPFCAELASQPVGDGDFTSHDHCSCTAEPVFA